jgi:hypothetical protein
MFRGNPCDNRVQSIVGHGTNSWELDMSTNGCLVFNVGNATNISNYLTNQPASGSAAGDIKTIGVYNDGKWHQVVAVNQTNTVSIYVDGRLDTNGTPGYTSSTAAIKGITADLMIGADPSFTNNPVGVGRQFSGQICDVAFYTSALSAADVQALYALTVPVVVTVNPNSTNIVFSVTNNLITLSWPFDHTGWTLQAQTNDVTVGLSTNWVNVAGSMTTNQVTEPVDPNNGTVFYRLFYAP